MSAFDDAVTSAELARTQGNLLSEQLAAAQQKVAALEGLREVDQAEIARLRAEIAELQARIDELEGSEPHRVLMGWWASSSIERDAAALEDLSGTKPDILRSRGGEGEFDDPWLVDETKRFVAKGYLPSLQIQPKVGTGPKRHGVGVERILAGSFDAKIRSGLNEWKQLPAGSYVVEVVSEANIQQAPFESQPFLAGFDAAKGACTRAMTPVEYAKLLRHIDRLAREEGVRARMKTCVSLTSGKWNSASKTDGWSGLNMTALLAPLVADGVVDLIAVDGYCGGKFSEANTPATIASGVRKVAAALGVPWSVMETGVVGTGAFKREWYRAWMAELDEQCYAFVQNVHREQDSDLLDFRPWVPEGALPGFQELMHGATL